MLSLVLPIASQSPPYSNVDEIHGHIQAERKQHCNASVTSEYINIKVIIILLIIQFNPNLPGPF